MPPGTALAPSGTPGMVGTTETPDPDESPGSTGSTWIFETFGLYESFEPEGVPETPGTSETSGPPGTSEGAGTSEAAWISGVAGTRGTARQSRHARPGRPRTGLSRRPWTLAALGGGLVAAAIGIVGLVAVRAKPADIPRPVAKLGIVPSGAAVAEPSPSAGQPAALPVALSIPAIDVSTKLIKLGVTAQGTLQVPTSTSVAGWYTGSPRPGDVGSSVIAGHIDSYLGPGVFFRLRLLRPGDLVYVREANGRLAVFRVNSVHMYPKNHFPTTAVYGPSPDAELHLITCGGVFDHATGSYLSNVVAYTTEVS
jgi:sortase (surface protein transpeptidase)